MVKAVAAVEAVVADKADLGREVRRDTRKREGGSRRMEEEEADTVKEREKRRFSGRAAATLPSFLVPVSFSLR